jgi:hypothetical protein
VFDAASPLDFANAVVAGTQWFGLVLVPGWGLHGGRRWSSMIERMPDGNLLLA